MEIKMKTTIIWSFVIFALISIGTFVILNFFNINNTESASTTTQPSALPSSIIISTTPPSPQLGIPPTINQLIPPSATVNSKITIKGSSFSKSGNTIKLTAQNTQSGYISDLPSQDGTTLTFTIPDGITLCSPTNQQNNKPCPGGYSRTLPGIYQLSVITNVGTSNTISLEII